MEAMDLHVQDAQQTPSKINSERFTLRHSTARFSGPKERILKALREKRLIM